MSLFHLCVLASWRESAFPAEPSAHPRQTAGQFWFIVDAAHRLEQNLSGPGGPPE